MISFKATNPNRLLVRGIISIIIGITVIVAPGLSLATVMQVLGALMVVDGIIALLVNYYGKNKSTFLIVPRGTTNLFIGIILLIFPSLLINVFVFVIGLLLVLAGFSQLTNIIGGRSTLGFSWGLTIISLVALIAGIVLLTKPFESAEAILTFFGVIVSIYGIGEVIWSVKIRKVQKQNSRKGTDVIDTDYEEIK